MEPLLIYPESAQQLKTVKAVLKALNVQFGTQTATLPKHVLKGIERGLEQAKNGQTISLQEFKEKHFTKK